MYFIETTHWEHLAGTQFPVRNGHLIARFHALRQVLKEEEDIDFIVEKVKAHSGYEGNEIADGLANDARRYHAPSWLSRDDLLPERPVYRGLGPLRQIDDRVLGRAITSAIYGKARGPDNVDGWMVKIAWQLTHPPHRSTKLKKRPETEKQREEWLRRYILAHPTVTGSETTDDCVRRLADVWNHPGGHRRIQKLVATYGEAAPPESPPPTAEQAQTFTAAVALIETLRNLLQHVFHTGEVPRAWGRSTIVALPKKAKVRSGADTRGISLMSHTAKIASRIIARRLNSVPLAQWQNGFRAKKSTMHAAGVLKELMQQYRRRGKTLHCVFIDCTKAFDLTSRGAIDAALEKAGVSETERQLVANMLKAEMDVVGQDKDQPRLETRSGVRQGCPASPVYFILAMDAAIRKAGLTPFLPQGFANGTQADFAILGYADDLVLLHDNAATLQGNVTKALEALRAIGLECNVNKTKSLSLAERPPNHTSRQTMTRVEAARRATDVVQPVARVIADIVKPESDRHSTAVGSQRTMMFATATGTQPNSFKCPCCDAHRKDTNAIVRHLRMHGYDSDTITMIRCDRCNVWHSSKAKHSVAQCNSMDEPCGSTVVCNGCRTRYDRGSKAHYCANRPLDVANANPPLVPDLVLRRGDDADETRAPATMIERQFFPLDDDADNPGARTPFEQVHTFTYLGTVVSDCWKGRQCEDLRQKMNKGKQLAFKCARFLRETHLPRKARMLLVRQHVFAAALYGCELWAPVTQTEMKRVLSLQCTCLRWVENLRPVVKIDCTCGRKTRLAGCTCRRSFEYPHNVDVLKTARQEDIRQQILRRQFHFAEDVLQFRTDAMPEHLVRCFRTRPGEGRCSVGPTLYEHLAKAEKPASHNKNPQP